MFNIQDLLQKQFFEDFTKMFKPENGNSQKTLAMKNMKLENEIATTEETLFLLNTFQA